MWCRGIRYDPYSHCEERRDEAISGIPRSPRRPCWLLAMTAALLIAAPANAATGPGGYPDRPVRVIVPVAAAGGTDIIARIVLAKLAEDTGRQFVVDNRPG